MSYLTLNPEGLQKVLETIGIENPEDVYSGIPETLLSSKDLDIPGPLDEEAVRSRFTFDSSNVVFAGGGVYRHHIPSIVNALSSRQEFYTAYTPYQPEISQGTLQAIFEYQSMLSGLTGMYASNASMYDGATALAEAALMAVRKKKVRRILYTRTINPSYRAVMMTYLRHIPDLELTEIPYDPLTGRADTDVLKEKTTGDAALFIQQPNFFGIIEPMEEIASIAQDAGFFGIAVSEAMSLGLLSPPGAYGPDVVVGDAQSFGNPVSAGGPLLGFLCTSKTHIRNMPGRIAGLTRDTSGRESFCLTLSTREQHIRREKATSNICTNQGLCALRAAIYLSAMGPEGLRKAATQCASGARHLMKGMEERGITPIFNGPVFNEFVVKMEETKQTAMIADGIVPGIPISRHYPEISDGLLVTVTEMNTKEDCACLMKHI